MSTMENTGWSSYTLALPGLGKLACVPVRASGAEEGSLSELGRALGAKEDKDFQLPST